MPVEIKNSKFPGGTIMSVISYCLCGLLVSNKSGLGEIGGPGNFFWNFFEIVLLGENQLTIQKYISVYRFWNS